MRHITHQKKRDKHGKEKRQKGLEDFGDCCAGNTATDEENAAHGWRAKSNAEVHDHDDAEMDGMNAQFQDNGQENRSEDQDSRRDIHKSSDSQEQ